MDYLIKAKFVIDKTIDFFMTIDIKLQITFDF